MNQRFYKSFSVLNNKLCSIYKYPNRVFYSETEWNEFGTPLFLQPVGSNQGLCEYSSLYDKLYEVEVKNPRWVFFLRNKHQPYYKYIFEKSDLSIENVWKLFSLEECTNINAIDPLYFSKADGYALICDAVKLVRHVQNEYIVDRYAKNWQANYEEMFPCK